MSRYRHRPRCSPSSCRCRSSRGCGRMPPRRGGRCPPWSRRPLRSSWRRRTESLRAGEPARDRDRVRLRSPAGRGIVSGLPHSLSPNDPRAASRAGQEASNAADEQAQQSYARVSSAHHKEQETIRSQSTALRTHAEQLGLDVPEAAVLRRRQPFRGESGSAGVRAAARPGVPGPVGCAPRLLAGSGSPANMPLRLC